MLGIAWDTLIAFAVTSALIELTPGPNMAYLAVLSATQGRHKGYAAVLGVALGLSIVGMAAALGLAAIISASPVLFQALRWAGVAYLFWLAWDAWRPEQAEENEFSSSEGTYFRRGLVVNLLNPKAGVFYVVIVPQFVSADAPLAAQTVTLSLVYVAIATAIHASIVTLAGFSQRYLSDVDRRQIVRRVMALALVGIAVWFAWSTQT